MIFNIRSENEKITMNKTAVIIVSISSLIAISSKTSVSFDSWNT